MNLPGQHYIIDVAKKYVLIFVVICSLKASAQPVANFSATSVSGCAPFTISFLDNSTGTPTSWRWNLGNGTISGLQNPSATYFTPGVYNISLTVSNQYGSSTLTRNAYIKVYDKPIVNFNASITTGCVPVSTSFTDSSSSAFGNIIKWEWDFNDGDTSLLQNPVHTFTAVNNYAITLKVTNSNGCATTISKPQFIKAGEPAKAKFNFTPGTNCRPPETISFINLSTGPGVLSYRWNFGDTTSSTTASPFHTYLSGGTYSLQLVTSSSYGCADTMTIPNSLLIKNVASAFTGTDSICAGVNAFFSNVSVPAPVSYSWNFGDGSGSILNNPSKIWNGPGNYTVKLVNNFGSCLDSVTKTIRVMALPVAKFSTTDTAGCNAPFSAIFTDQSTGATGWLWDFGDGSTSFLANPTHTYNSRDSFSVSLTVTNSNGCSSISRRNHYIKVLKPVIRVNDIPFEGCVPLIVSPAATIFSADGIAAYDWDFGNGTSAVVQSPSAVYTSPGNYDIKLVVTTNRGCRDSLVLPNAVHAGIHPVTDFTASPLTQCASSNIQFTDQSVPADKWEWHFGDSTLAFLQNPLHVYNDTGTFSIKLVAWNNGCKDSLTKVNYITTLPPVARFSPLYNCSNRKEISFTDKSILPQSWSWDFGDGTTSSDQNPVHIFPDFQTYNVSLTVTNGNCSSTQTSVVHPINEQPVFTVSKNFLCKSDSVLFKAVNSNAGAIARYNWNFGDNHNESVAVPAIFHTYQQPGIYAVTLQTKDLNGCIDSIFKSNLIHVYGPKAGFAASPVSGCAPATVNFTDTSNTDGINNLSKWEWHYGDGQTQVFLSAAYSSPSHTYLNAGSFMPTLTVTDSLGCTDSTSMAPIFFTKPAAAFTADNTNACPGSNVVFFNASSGAGLTCSWEFGDGSFSSSPSPAKQYSTNGNYTVKLVATDVNGCKDSTERTSYIKVQNTVASFNQSDSLSSCTPFRVNFTNTSLFSVFQKWDFGDGSTSSLANPVHYFSSPGNYTIQLQSIRSASCSNRITKQIVVYPPSARLSYTPLNGCAPLNVSFKITTPGKVSYLWDFNDGNTVATSDSFYMHSYTLPGVFVPKIILKDSTGCLIPVSGNDTIRMYSSKVNFGVQDSLFCDNGMAVFTDSTISGSPVTNYTWNFGDGAISHMQHPVHYFNSPGLYTVGLFTSTAFGCNDSAVKQQYIKVVKTPVATIAGDSILCGPSAVTLNGILLQADTAAISWHWTFNNSTIYDIQNPPVLQYDTAGNYPVQFIATNSSGCADTVNRNITIHPMPQTFAGNDTTICLGTSAALAASGADSYTWSPANYLSCDTCGNTWAALPNSQLLYVKGNNVFGCEITDSIFVTVKKPFLLLVSPSADSICINQSMQLHAGGAENYNWSPAAGLSDAAIGTPYASPQVSTVYTVIGFDSSRCFYDTAFVNIRVFPYPTVDAGRDRTINIGTSVLLQPNYSADVVKWLWDQAPGLSCNDCPAPAATPPANTTYKVEVTNNGGCTASDEVRISVECDNNNLWLPNAFTPDGNGTNDVFYPQGVGIFRIQSLKIFNRWGDLMFQRNNFLPNDKSKGWNGFYKGRVAASGNYVYLIEIICSNSIVLSRTGNILLLK